MLSGWLVVPRIITDAYFDNSLPTINDLIAASRHPLEYYLQYWQPIADAGVGVIAVLGLFAYSLLTPRYSQRLVQAASPESLGAIRILVCSLLFIMCVWEDLGSSTALPRGLIRPMGLLDIFYALPLGFEQFVASHTALAIFQWVTAVLLLMGAVGWRARLTVLAGGLCYLVMAGILRHDAWFYHTGLIPVYLAVWLAWTPCGDGWSLDRWLQQRRRESVAPDRPAAVYGWARYGCWLLIALPYVAAGMSKLRNGGWMWWDATNFRHILFRGTMNPMHFDFKLSLALVSVPDAVVEMLALSALLGELLFGLVLFFRAARIVLPIVMIGMHSRHSVFAEYSFSRPHPATGILFQSGWHNAQRGGICGREPVNVVVASRAQVRQAIGSRRGRLRARWRLSVPAHRRDDSTVTKLARPS